MMFAVRSAFSFAFLTAISLSFGASDIAKNITVGGSFCYPRGYGPESNPICLAWGRSGADIVFRMTCSPDPPYPYFSLSWCAIGFSTSLSPTWGMWPAEVVHLQLMGGVGPTVVLTDRITRGVHLPPCAPTQVTRLLNASVDSSTGVLTAFFSRTALLPPKLLAEGYTNLANRNVNLIAAISNNGPQNTSGCASTFVPHDNEWWNVSIAV